MANLELRHYFDARNNIGYYPGLLRPDRRIVGDLGRLKETARPRYPKGKLRRALIGANLASFLVPGLINNLDSLTQDLFVDLGHNQTYISAPDHYQYSALPSSFDHQAVTAEGKQTINNFTQEFTLKTAEAAIGLYERFFDDKLGFMHPRLVKAGLSVMGYEKRQGLSATDLGRLAVKRLQKLGATPKDIVLGVLASAVGIYPDKEKLGKWWIVEYLNKKGGGIVADINPKPEDQSMIATIREQLGKNLRSLEEDNGWGAKADNETNRGEIQIKNSNSLASTEIPDGHSVVKINGQYFMIEGFSSAVVGATYAYYTLGAKSIVEIPSGAVLVKDIVTGSITGILVLQLVGTTNVVQNASEGRPVIVRWDNAIHVINTQTGKVDVIEFVNDDAVQNAAEAENAAVGEQSNTQAREEEKVSQNQPRRIAIVDDNPTSAEVLGELATIRLTNSQIYTFKICQELLATMDSGQMFDAYIIDYDPGETDGLWGDVCTQEIISRHPGALVVGQSGERSDSVESEFMQAGARKFHRRWEDSDILLEYLKNELH